MLKGFFVSVCVFVCVCERECVRVCARVSVCVSSFLLLHIVHQNYTGRGMSVNRINSQKQSGSLQLDALCLHLSNPYHIATHTHTNTRTHAHTHTHTPMSPSIHLLDMIVPLLLLYVLIHQLWVKWQLHPAIDAARRQTQSYGMVHYSKLLLKLLFSCGAWGASGE